MYKSVRTSCAWHQNLKFVKESIEREANHLFFPLFLYFLSTVLGKANYAHTVISIETNQL